MTHTGTEKKMRIAVGPKNPEFGSWNWVGESFLKALNDRFFATSFEHHADIETTDTVIFVKFKPTLTELQSLKQRARLVYCPIDIYADAREIDDDRASLQCFDRVLLHSERLLRYFTACCPVGYIDHPIKYVLKEPRTFESMGPLLWVGRQCNLQPVVQWTNRQKLNRELWILTNRGERRLDTQSLGFENRNTVKVSEWSERRHLECLKVATAAIDIKGDDFRARHKPPAKMLDFLASGLPVIANRSSPSYWLGKTQGLSVIDADNWQLQLVEVDRARTFRQARQLQQVLSEENCANQIIRVVTDLLSPVSPEPVEVAS